MIEFLIATESVWQFFAVYIIVGLTVSFLASLFGEDKENASVLGGFWLPLAALLVLYAPVALVKFCFRYFISLGARTRDILEEDEPND